MNQAAPVNNPIASPVHPLSETITQSLERLRSLSQVSVQPGWRYYDGDLPVEEALTSENWPSWTLGEVNAKDHHPWSKGRQVRWFSRVIQVPTDLNGFPLTGLCLRLALLWWSEETHVYVNGKLAQAGDLFDCAPRLLLSESVQPGDEFAIALRLISPIHDDGALMKAVCHYEAFSPDTPLEPSFIANEIAVLHAYLEKFDPEQLKFLADTLSSLDWNALHPPHRTDVLAACLFGESLRHLRESLLPLAEPIKQRQITLLGHAHLDMAWLWTVEETWKAAERTFQSVLNLQKDFPELTFAHTTPALYEWMEHHRPDLFTQIQAQVKAGKWEIVAGFWIEPELNLISGESIARQIFYGQRYLQEKFGEICAIAWVPDTFGFTWQLPQLLKQGGVEYFVTQKLRWNDTTQFPYELFQWEAPDGTQILSLMSAPIGEFIDPVKMATFAWNWEQKTGLQTTLWLPGVGDHGGGPTRDMLEVARRWQQSPFFPQMEWGTALEYLEAIKEGDGQEVDSVGASLSGEKMGEFIKLQNSPRQCPIWNSELYLEYHRGCYTTHADQKQHNRSAEEALYEAELWSALAAIATGTPYPKAELERLWKDVLLNQFHDILPGSSITPVFDEANEVWETAKFNSWEITAKAQRSLAKNMAIPAPPHPDAKLLVVFNLLNWARTELVKTDVWVRPDEMRDWQICDLDGTAIAQQNQHRPLGNSLYCISFVAAQIPAIGYRTYWICPCDTPAQTPDLPIQEFGLENAYLRVTIDPTTGEIASIFDKINNYEVLSAPGNQLQAFADTGQYWDAWNINPNYAEHLLPAPELVTIETGHSAFQEAVDQPLTAFQHRVYVERKIGQSVFHQTYTLEQNSPILKIETHVDWQERHTLVKATFPLNLEADFATYEIPCGAIARTTKPQTAAEKAQWEVPAMRWADLSAGSYGVSLLNDCKYGYDAKSNQLRLTLLRGSEWPDPEADKGQHTFTYAIYPHAGDWRQAQTVRRGHEFNMPLHAVEVGVDELHPTGTLPPVASLLDLGDENLVLMALKQAENSAHEWILRCHECHGKEAQLNLSSDLNLHLGQRVDLLERSRPDQTMQGPMAGIRPWEIASFKMTAN
ncbi:MAG: alpha-mannosidase [Leptolyngbyaceae cyanobacterium bins.349]|nr:alpha-mannosidase [Leptolyngbyaceae cyanobacterium bins.349]